MYTCLITYTYYHIGLPIYKFCIENNFVLKLKIWKIVLTLTRCFETPLFKIHAVMLYWLSAWMSPQNLTNLRAHLRQLGWKSASRHWCHVSYWKNAPFVRVHFIIAGCENICEEAGLHWEKVTIVVFVIVHSDSSDHLLHRPESGWVKIQCEELFSVRWRDIQPLQIVENKVWLYETSWKTSFPGRMECLGLYIPAIWKCIFREIIN